MVCISPLFIIPDPVSVPAPMYIPCLVSLAVSGEWNFYVFRSDQEPDEEGEEEEEPEMPQRVDSDLFMDRFSLPSLRLSLPLFYLPSSSSLFLFLNLSPPIMAPTS